MVSMRWAMVLGTGVHVYVFDSFFSPSYSHNPNVLGTGRGHKLSYRPAY